MPPRKPSHAFSPRTTYVDDSGLMFSGVSCLELILKAQRISIVALHALAKHAISINLSAGKTELLLCFAGEGARTVAPAFCPKQNTPGVYLLVFF